MPTKFPGWVARDRYCWNTTCTGSEIAAVELDRLGYRAVHRYVDGKRDWTDQGGPIVSAPT